MGDRSGSRFVVSRLSAGLIVAVGVVVSIVLVLFFIRETSMINSWKSSGFVLSSVQDAQPDRTVIVWRAEPSDYVSGAIPARGDTLLTMNGQKASYQTWIDLLETPHTPGREVTVTFRHKGEVETGVIRTRPVQHAHFFAVVLAQVLKGLIFITFLVVGFWGFLRRSDSPGARALALYTFSMAGFMGLTYMPMFPVMATFNVPQYNSIRNLLSTYSAFFSAFWLYLNLVFPRPVHWAKGRSWLAFLVSIAPQVLLIAFIIGFQVRDGSAWVGQAVYTVWATQVLAGLLILRHHHIHAESNLEKRQTRLIFWGSGAGLVLFLLYQLDNNGIVIGLRMLPLFARMMLTNIVFFVLLASPITIAYAFGRYRLLEVQGRLRRGTRYALVTITLLAVFVVVLYGAGVLLLDALGVSSRTPTLLVALVLAIGFAPAHRRLQQGVEHHIFPERARFSAMANDFLKQASTLPDIASLCGALRERLTASLGVETVHCVLRGQENGHLRPMGGDSISFEEQGEMMVCLKTRGHPLFVDEALAMDEICFSQDEWDWIERNHVALLLPLRTHERMIGFIALGQKVDREDFHPEELRVLTSLSDQVALMLENLRLLSENLEKQRMEQELLLARDVQMKFLPLHLPETPGLELAAHSEFSVEVAGDYYDVIPLEDGRTLLAVGDVSGKGAGAALVMANLQASLRAFCGIGLTLSELVARINRMIYTNTADETYITFFTALFDPRDRSLTYVNAGHNPPLLHQGDSVCRCLDAGGLVLGVFEDVHYQQETLMLNPGDRVLIYTDGLSEAMDGNGREYGDQRIEELLLEQNGVPGSDILATLTSRVRDYRGSDLLEDDMTMLLMKVLP